MLVFPKDSSIACKDAKILNGLGTIQLDLTYGHSGYEIASRKQYAGPAN